MKKSIILTEAQILKLREFKEEILKPSTKLSPFIYKRIKAKATSMGDNDAFPPTDGYTFEYKIFKQRLADIIENLTKFSDIEEYSEMYLTNKLSGLITRCKELEEPIKPNLEKICVNSILRLFEIPSETVNFDVELVDTIEPSRAYRIDAEPKGSDKFEFEDLNDFKNSSKAVLKRRLINGLIQGAAYVYSNAEALYEDELNTINKELLPLYKEIIAINDYLLFIKEEKITDKTPMQGGYVEVVLGKNKERTTINAQAILFPFLLFELIKGFFELFASHGLPQDEEKAKYILKNADFLKAEPWDLRIGVGLWEIINKHIETTNVLPYFFSSLCELPIKEFNKSLQEIFAQTKKGNHLLRHLIDNAQEEVESQGYVPIINVKKATEALIVDSINLRENTEDEAHYNYNEKERGIYPYDWQEDKDWADMDEKERKLIRYLAKKNGESDLEKIAKTRLVRQNNAVQSGLNHFKDVPYSNYKDTNKTLNDIIIQRILDKNNGRPIWTKDDLKRHLDFDTEVMTTLSGADANKKKLETNFDATKLGQLITHGNMKLSADILIVNLTAAKNCPSAKKGMCPIYNTFKQAKDKGEKPDVECYAQKGEHQYVNTIQNNIRSEIVMSLLDTDEFIAYIEEYIERFDYKTNYIRFNEAGDFPSQEFVERCEKASEYFFKHYGIQCSAYTCRSDLDFSNCKYMIINASLPIIKGSDRFYQAVTKKRFDSYEDTEGSIKYTENGEPYFKCKCNCKVCKFCYQSRGQNGEDPNKITKVFCEYH